MLTSEGLTLFANDSYTRSKPGTEILQLLEYKTRGDLFEAGLSYPFIRSREKNLIAHRAVLHQQRPQRHPRRAQHARPDPRRAAEGRRRLRRPAARHQPDQPGAQPGHRGPWRHRPPASPEPVAGQRAVRLHQVRGDLQPAAAAAGRLLGAAGRLRPVGQHPPALARSSAAMAGEPSGAPSTPRSWSATAASSSWGSCASTSPIPCKISRSFSSIRYADRGWLHNLAPVAVTPANVDGASVGGGLRLGLQPGLTVDLSAAKGVAGIRDDWRFFFITTGRY